MSEFSEAPKCQRRKPILFYFFVVFFLGVLPALLTWIVRSDPQTLNRWGLPVGPAALYVVLGGSMGLMCGIARNKLSSMLVGLNVGAGLGLCFSFLQDSRAMGMGYPQTYFAALALSLICGVTLYDKDEGIISFWSGCGTGLVAAIIEVLSLALGVLAIIYTGLEYSTRIGTLGMIDLFAGTVPPAIGSAFIFNRLRSDKTNNPAGSE